MARRTREAGMANPMVRGRPGRGARIRAAAGAQPTLTVGPVCVRRPIETSMCIFCTCWLPWVFSGDEIHLTEKQVWSMCPISRSLHPYSDVHIDVVSCPRPIISVTIPVSCLGERWNCWVELTDEEIDAIVEWARINKVRPGISLPREFYHEANRKKLRLHGTPKSSASLPQASGRN